MRDALNVGDVVTVEGRQARDDSSNASAQTVTLTVTGESLFNGTAPPSR